MSKSSSSILSSYIGHPPTPQEWQEIHAHIHYEMLSVLSRKIKNGALSSHGSCIGALSPDATALYDKSRSILREMMTTGAITVTIKGNAEFTGKHANLCPEAPLQLSVTIPLPLFVELLSASASTTVNQIALAAATEQMKDTFTDSALKSMYVKNAVLSLF